MYVGENVVILDNVSREGLLRKESMAGRGMEAKGRSSGSREAGAAKQPGEASGNGGRA